MDLQRLGTDDNALAEGTAELADADDAASGDALQSYLRDIRRAPLLSVEEEQVTAALARRGDFAARQRMIERNLRLVVSIAKHHTGPRPAAGGPDRGGQPGADARHRQVRA